MFSKKASKFEPKKQVKNKISSNGNAAKSTDEQKSVPDLICKVSCCWLK